MLTFLLVIQAIVAVLLVGVILMQQSEGGGLGMGGSPTGLMSARGAADFLTRATTILAAIFISLSILHAVLAVQVNRVGTVDTSLAKKVAPAVALPAVPTEDGAVPTAGGAVPMGNVPSAPLAVPMANAAPKVQPQQRAERTSQPERTRPAPRASDAPPPIAATVPAPSAGGNSN